jgi:hypothetical protein
MVFSINAVTTGDKTFSNYKALAVKTNGTSLVQGNLQSVDPAAAAAPTTVTVIAGNGSGGASATAAPPASGTVAGDQSVATVVAGTGSDSQGNVCTCSCLCGVNSFPANVAVGSFGGFPALLSV